MEGWKDRAGGEQGWRGKAARLTPCWLVCLSRTLSLSGALAWRASSPPPPLLEPDPSRALPLPLSSTLSQLALGERLSWIPKSVCPRPSRRAKLGHSGLGVGRTHRALNTLGPLHPGPPCSRCSPAALTFFRSHGPKIKRSHSESSRIFPERREGGMGPGQAGAGLGRGALDWRAGGWLSARLTGGAASGLSARSERGAGGGARAGEKVGSDSGGGRGRGSVVLQSRPRPARPLPPGWGHRR